MQSKEEIKPVKERNNLDLLELVLQLHARAIHFPSNEMHDTFWEARRELEKRLQFQSPQSKDVEAKEAIEFADWIDKKGWDKNPYNLKWYNNIDHPVTTAELYKLFEGGKLSQ